MESFAAEIKTAAFWSPVDAKQVLFSTASVVLTSRITTLLQVYAAMSTLGNLCMAGSHANIPAVLEVLVRGLDAGSLIARTHCAEVPELHSAGTCQTQSRPLPTGSRSVCHPV